MKSVGKFLGSVVVSAALVAGVVPQVAMAASSYPVVVSAPVMTNTTETGAYKIMDVLSVTDGAWTNASSYTYQWWRCAYVQSDLKSPTFGNEVTDPTVTGNSGYTYSRYNIINWQLPRCVRIGTNSNTYELKGEDIDMWVSATVSATSSTGQVTTMSANWGATAVQPAPPVMVTPNVGGYTTNHLEVTASTWKGVRQYQGWTAGVCPSPLPANLNDCAYRTTVGGGSTTSQTPYTDYNIGSCMCVAPSYPAYYVVRQTVYGWDGKWYYSYWTSDPVLGRVPLAPTLATYGRNGSLLVVVNPTRTNTWDSTINGYWSEKFPPSSFTVSMPGQADCVIDIATATMLYGGYLCQFSGLTNYESYSVSATASNSVGTSGPTVASGMPGPAPGPIVNAATTAGDKKLTVSWSPPTTGTTPTMYYVERTDTGAFVCSVNLATNPTAALSCDVTGLTNGVNYPFRIVASNTFGSSTATTSGTPSAGSPATNVTAPIVTDREGNQPPHVNDVLSLSNGEWTTATSSFTYKWYSCTAPSASPATDSKCAVVSGATGSTYSPTSSDAGKYFTGTVTATGTNGTTTTKAASSSVGPVVAHPSAPSDVVVTSASGSASVSWTAPANDGGSSITGYSVRYSSDDGATWTEATCTGTSTSCDITGLTDGETYVFEVMALNAVGNSSYVRSDSVIPNPPPGTVVAAIGTPGNGVASISWSSPADGTAPTSYDVYNTTTGALVCHIDLVANPGAALSCDQTGLTNGTNYGFKIIATNEFGSSTAELNVTPTAGNPASNDLPPVVTNTTGHVVPTVGDELTVSDGAWTSSTDSYTYQWYACSAPSTSPASDANCSLISGATSNIYTLSDGEFGKYVTATVTATGTDGSTTARAADSVGPVKDVPGMPTNVVGSPRPTGAHLTWNAPSNNGGSPITGYVVEYSSDGGVTWTAANCPGTGTSCDISGLTDLVGYDFRVGAVTAVGEGDLAPTSAEVVPYSAPSAPSFILTEAGDGSVFVEWAVPDNDGGGAISGYILQYSPDGGTTWVTAQNSTSLTNATINGLVNGTHYLFRAAARNGAGIGAYAVTSTTTTPVTTPNAPSVVSAIPNADRTGITVTIAPPSNTGGSAITSHIINVYDASGNEVGSCVTTSRSCTVLGLTPGATYTIDAVTTTAVGRSGHSRPASVALTVVYKKVNAYIRGWSFAQREVSGGMFKDISLAARAIVAGNNKKVTVTGFANFTAKMSLSRDRAINVAAVLRRALDRLGGKNITITTVTGGNTTKFGGTVLNRVAVIQGR